MNSGSAWKNGPSSTSARYAHSLAECGAWIPDDRKGDCERAAGVYQCANYQTHAEADKHPRAGSSPPPLRPGRVRRSRGEPPCALLDCRKEQGGAGEGIAIKGYTILKELGRGGMGSVWLSRHDGTGGRSP